MNESHDSAVSSGLLLTLLGFWLLMQTIIGDLPRRLLSWTMSSGAGSSSSSLGGAIINGLAGGGIGALQNLGVISAVTPGTGAGTPNQSPVTAVSFPLPAQQELVPSAVWN